MKHKTFSRRPGARNRGMALVLVLSMLVLISALIVGFLSSISVEMQSSKSYAEGASAKLLADNAVSLAIAQLAEATREPDLAWASQPGLIRTYDDRGAPAAAYKLYSSDIMKVEGAFDPGAALAVEVPADWNDPGNKSTFTDINEPVAIGAETYYPILAADSLDGSIPGLHSSRGAEMPVRWLYVLKDGSMAPLVNGLVDGAGENNPIVGRVAFWADDESAKVNINTASEGHFWARPWADGTDERALAGRIPGRDEFQAYPGHPATTSLSAVLNLPGATAQQADYFNLAPRVAFGGTRGGSQAAPNNPVSLDSDRLYASIHELQYKPNRSRYNPNYLNSQSLEKLQFLLTTSSRAPELNLWNKPRVSLWPLQIEPNLRNAKDKLFAFASELKDPSGTGKLPYYFQRASAWTPPHPNYTPLSSQSIDRDWTEIERNQELYEYLQGFMESPVPGFGGQFGGAGGKLGTDSDQVLTEMFDYVRSNINGMSPQYALPPIYYYFPTRAGDKKLGFPEQALPAEGQVVPLIPPGTDTKGFGRFTTVTEAAIVFIRSNNWPSDPAATDPGTTRMQGVLLLENFNPTPGLPTWSPHCTFRIRDLEKLKVNGLTVFPDETRAINPVTGIAGRQGGHGHGTAFNSILANFGYCATEGPNYGIDKGNYKAVDPTATNFLNRYTLCTPQINVEGQSTFAFSGGKITVEIYAGTVLDFTNVTPVQTLEFDFPADTPLVPMKPTGPKPTNAWDYNRRVGALVAANEGETPPKTSYANALVINGDIVLSVHAKAGAPCYGDYRLIAGMKHVPADFFERHKNYGSLVGTTVEGSHSLRGPGYGDMTLQDEYNYNRGLPGSRIQASLVQGVDYPATRQPSTSPDLNGAMLSNGRPGDWDTGPGNSPDGPYLNKTDYSTQEGNKSWEAYYHLHGVTLEPGKTYSPNRQIASAVSFGSLPTGIKRGLPWQTLAFSPNPAGGSLHPGLQTPPDHLLLDLFTMPIVEPYAISEPFSSAGKINMNYQIAPFTYLHRSTGLRAVMKSVKMMAIPTDDVDKYKFKGSQSYRYNIDMGDGDPATNRSTLKGFEDRFNSGDIFRSASEICEVFLVPEDAPSSPNYDDMETWWDDYRLTGDNVREEPYGYIYPRLTTKSNSYTVHVRAQTLKKVRGTPEDTFMDPATPGRSDEITGEFRGAFTIQRYLNPNTDTYVQWDGSDWQPATETDPEAVVGPYRVRVINVKQFAP